LRSESPRAVLLLFLILAACFAPCIWGNKTLLESAGDVPSIVPGGAWAGKPIELRYSKVLDPGAPGWQSEPLTALVGREYFEEKTLPLWNPYQGYGKPLAANMVSQPFFPLTALLSGMVGPTTYNWFILARLLIAGVCTYFYLRYFVSYLAAVTGGIAAMLAGYYILYITMFQLSVDTLMSLALLCSEYLLRRRSYAAFLSYSAMIAVVLLGGMPECALLLLTLVHLYWIFRLAVDPGLRSTWSRVCVRFLVADFAGVALSAFLLLPFFEFLRLSFDTHQAGNLGGVVRGLLHDSFGWHALTQFFPLLFGPPHGLNGWAGIRGYCGAVATFLVLIAIVGAFSRTSRMLASLTFFFAGCFIVIELKRYGAPVVNWLGALPLYNLLDFPEYGEATAAICAAVLVAIGIERLLKRDVSFATKAACLAGTAVLIVLAYARPNEVLPAGEDSALYARLAHYALLLPTILIAVILFAWLVTAAAKLKPLYLAGTCAVCLCLDLSLNYIVPTYYHVSRMARASSNPYKGAPYIDFLKTHAGQNRVVAQDKYLFPEWASAFGLQDVRDLDAMFYRKYFPFVRAFLSHDQTQTRDELYDRFAGFPEIDFRQALPLRLLQLSSVKFVVQTSIYASPDPIVNEILDQNAGRLAPGHENQISHKSFLLAGIDSESLGEHPPYSRLPYTVKIAPDKSVFHFAYAIDPAVFDKSLGDGVGFRVEIQNRTGKVTPGFYAYIDPKHNPSERRWMFGQVDVRPYRNQTIRILFSTDPGPRGDTNYDWAAWSGFHFDNDPLWHGPKPFKLVSDGSPRVYEYDAALPRAALYQHVDLVNSDQDALHRLTDPAFDPTKSAVVSEASLSADQRAKVDAINRNQAQPVEAAKVVRYRSQDVDIEAATAQPALLVLNDSDYPGWQAQLDGNRARWVTANYLFRGLLLPPGRHTIRFQYKPKSFELGALISGLAALLLVGCYIPVHRMKTAATMPPATGPKMGTQA
jgi:hypothetical protein